MVGWWRPRSATWSVVIVAGMLFLTSWIQEIDADARFDYEKEFELKEQEKELEESLKKLEGIVADESKTEYIDIKDSSLPGHDEELTLKEPKELAEMLSKLIDNESNEGISMAEGSTDKDTGSSMEENHQPSHQEHSHSKSSDPNKAPIIGNFDDLVLIMKEEEAGGPAYEVNSGMDQNSPGSFEERLASSEKDEDVSARIMNVLEPTVNMDRDLLEPAGNTERDPLPPVGSIISDPLPPAANTPPPAGNVDSDLPPPSERTDSDPLPPSGNTDQDISEPAGNMYPSDLPSDLSEEDSSKESNLVPPGNMEIDLPEAINLPPEAMNLPPEAMNLPPEAMNLPPEAMYLPPEAMNVPPEVMNVPPEVVDTLPEDMGILSEAVDALPESNTILLPDNVLDNEPVNLETTEDMEDLEVDEDDIPILFSTEDAKRSSEEDSSVEEDLGEEVEADEDLGLEDLPDVFDIRVVLSEMGIERDRPLASLSEKQLNRLLKIWRKWLKNGLEEVVRKELQRSDQTWDTITNTMLSGATPPPPSQRTLPQTYPSITHPGQTYPGEAPVPLHYGAEEPMATQIPGEFWQPYIFDTGVGNRKDIKIESVDVVGRLRGPHIAKMIKLNLQGMSVLYVSRDGLGYIEVDGELQPLVILNQWTRSSSGCQCGHDRPSKECACCMPGGCVCRGASNICVACGSEHSCKATDLSSVQVTDAAGTVVGSHDGFLNLNLLAVAYGNSINFFNHISGGGNLKWVGSMTLHYEVTHLAFGTIFTDHDEATSENTFLMVFSRHTTEHQFNEIIVSSRAPTFTVGAPVKWVAKGHSMKVHQGDGQVLVTVHENHYINTFILQEDKWMQHHLVHQHTFRGAFLHYLIFELNFETYIALAAQRHLIFYRWNRMEGEFVQLNTLYLGDGLTNIEGLATVNVESCQEQVSVVVAGHGKHVAVIALQYNFTTNTQAFTVEFHGSLQHSLDWSIAAHHSTGSSRFVALVSSTGEVAVVQVKTSMEEILHPLGTQRDALDNAIEYIKSENARQQAIVTAAEGRLAKSVLFSNTVLANVTITGSITISGVLDTGRLSAVRLVFPNTELERGVTHLEYLHHISTARPGADLSNRLLQDLQTIENTLVHAVPASGPNRTIEGLKTIVTNNRLILNTVTIDSMSVAGLLDGSGAPFPLNATLSAIVRADQTGQLIRGRKTFASRLSVEHLHTAFLDDIPISDLVTTSGRESIAGAVFAQGVWVQQMNLRPGGTLAGLDLSQIVLLGQSAVLGRVTFSGQEFVSRTVDVISRMVGGIDLTRLYNNTLLVSGGNIAGSLLFTTDLSVEELTARIIMGVDLTQLAGSIVFKDEDAVLSGRLHLTQTARIEGDLTTSRINGGQFPSDYAVKVGSSPLVFTNEVSFNHVAFGEVSFGHQGLVDGIAPHRLVTRTTDQTITGGKVFTAGVDIIGHLNIDSKFLDGVNLDDLFSRERRRSSIPADWKFDLVCKGDVGIGRMFTRGTVNGLDLHALAQDLVYRNEREVRITGSKVFRNGLTLTNARFNGGFNGIDLGTFVTTDTNLVINGVLTFSQDVFFRSLVASRVNGMDLNALIQSALHLNKVEQVITGRKVFLKPVVIGSLFVEGSVQGVDFKNFVTKSGNQVFTAPQRFRSANFASLRTNSIQLSQGLKINGVDLSELARRRMPLREPVAHTATLTIEGPIEVSGTASIEIINGINLNEVLSTVVTDNGNHTISGRVSLTSLRVLGSVTTQGGVGANGISLQNMARNAIRLSANNQIASHLSFSRVEVRGELVVDGLVEGVKLGRLSQDAVYTNVQTLQTITGAKMFDQGFAVRGNIHTRTVNGIDLSKTLFSRTRDQIIPAPFTFFHMLARQNVFLQGLFNTFDLKTIAEETLTRNEEIVTKDVVFSGEVIVKHLVLRGTLQGTFGSVDVVTHLSDAVRLQDTAITITGKKIFTAGLSFRNLHIENLNGRNLDHFLALVVTRNRPHTLTGSVRVRGSIIAPWVTAQQLVVQGPIDGVDLEALRQVVVFLTGHQVVEASLVFREAVFVRGNLQTLFLNDLPLAEAYLTTSTSQTFNFNVTLSSAFATQVVVNGLVNSFNLPQEMNRTLMSPGGQNVLASLTLSGVVVVRRALVVGGRVGREQKVKLSQQVILLDQPTQVTSTLRFTAPLTVAWLRSSTGVVNGVHLLQLYRNAWFVDTSTAITTNVAFSGQVVIKRGFFSQGTVDGLEVQQAYRLAKAAQDGFRNITLEFEAKFERICHPIARLYNKLEACMYEGDHFIFHTSQPLPSVPHESISFYAYGTTVLLVSYEGLCHLDFMIWRGEHFVLHQRVEHSGYGQHFYLLRDVEDQVLVGMAASSFNNTCEQTNSTIWQVTTSGIKVYQQLGEGMYFSEGGSVGYSLLLHGLDYTLAYNLDHHTHQWQHVATLPSHAGGVVVHPNYGVIHILLDSTNATTYVRHVVSAVSRGGIKLLFGLYSTITTCQGPAHALKVFRVIEGTYYCIAQASLPTLPADLTVFFAGSKAAGSHIAVVTMHYNQHPIVFSFSGEVLTRWAEFEEAPSATWVQHALVRRPGQHFPDYYIFLSPLHHLPASKILTTTPDHTTPTHDTYPSTSDPYNTPPDSYNTPSSTPRPYTPFTFASTTSNPYDTPSTPHNPYHSFTSPSTTPNPYTSHSTPFTLFSLPSTTPDPYDTPSSTPQNPYHIFTLPTTTPKPYTTPTPFTLFSLPSTTPNPYDTPSSTPQNPYHIFTLPTTPPDHYTTHFTPNTYSIFTSPSTSNPYTMSTPSTPDPYDPFNPFELFPPPATRYVRSATYLSKPGITAIFELVMRGSAVAEANITCTRS